MGLTLEENLGNRRIPTVVKSEEDMVRDIPAARRVLEANGAMDLAEMIGVD